MRLLNRRQYFKFITLFTVSYGLHHLTIAQFNLATVSTTESRLTITAFKTNVIRRTSVQATFKCTPTTIAKTQQSIKKVSRDIEPLRSAWFSIASSMVNVRRTSIVDVANILSRTKLTWVILIIGYTLKFEFT